jgi:hypothetical protein
MKGWWVYDLFPEAWLEDQKRFWSAELFQYELEQRGFDARVHIGIDLARVPLAEIAGDTERRELSQLAILPGDAYARGLSRVRALVTDGAAGSWLSEIALIHVAAHLRP